MKKKQVTAFLLAAVLGVSALMTGCGDSKKKEETAGKEGGSKEFTAFMFLSGTPFNEDWEVWKEIEKETGVKLKGVVALLTLIIPQHSRTWLHQDNLQILLHVSLLLTLKNWEKTAVCFR